MFRIYLSDQKKQYPLYEPLDDTLHIYDPVLTQEMGRGGIFEFHIMADHPYADKIRLLKTEILVYRDDEEMFRGRVLKPEYNIKNMISVTCEGDLCYLVDSLQQPYEFSGNVAEFIEKLLEVHNSQVDDFKKMHPGIITVTDGGNEVVRSETKYTTTMEAFKTKLFEPLGGYLRVRNENGVKYLDYLWDFGGINQQVIRFGENLLDLNHYMDATSIITCLVPIGADVEYVDELGEKQVKTIEITAVNGGKNYIQDDAGIEEYGKVWGTYRWNDVTDPNKLLSKAKAYLKETAALPDTMEIKALDLSLIDENIQEFHLGFWTRISSEPHGIEKQLLLRKRVINLLNPADGSIDLGGVTKTFTDQIIKNQQDAMEAIDKVADSTSSEINRKVENATAMITGGLGGYVVLDTIDPRTGKKIHPWRILIMNTPDKNTAKNVIQFNQNGIGFSTTGINGPYSNAWTIDGNLIADFITTGTMLADRIRGGTLELGGTGIGRDGSIRIRDTSNNVTGQFDKNGIVIKGGKLELGGAQDGNIMVKDAGGKVIGTWDKTGLSILKGILQGVSAVFGGQDNQNGAIEVLNAGGRRIGRWDKDGLYILKGSLSVGPFEATEDGVIFGDWEVSADGSNILRSQDGNVIIQTRKGGGPTADHPMVTLTSANGTTEMSSYYLETQSLYSDRVLISETTEWGADTEYNGNVGMILDYIWKNKKYGIAHLGHEVRSLQSQVDDLYDMINSL